MADPPSHISKYPKANMGSGLIEEDRGWNGIGIWAHFQNQYHRTDTNHDHPGRDRVEMSFDLSAEVP